MRGVVRPAIIQTVLEKSLWGGAPASFFQSSDGQQRGIWICSAPSPGPLCCFGRMSDAAEIQAERGRGRQPQQLLKMRDIARIGLIIRILL